MRVLVTGASGFIGNSVVARLTQVWTGEVVAAGRVASANKTSQVRFEGIDLLSPLGPKQLIARTRPTHLLHLAWNVVPGQFWNSIDNLSWAAATTELLSEFVKAGGQRAVMAGTCAEYDWTGSGLLSEGMVCEPATLYGVVKDGLRRTVCMAGDTFKVPVAWGRVFWLYGPHEPRGRLVSDVAANLALGRICEVTSGHQRRDFLHVDDAATAFVSALMGYWSGPFNIGSGRSVSVREVVQTLGEAAGRTDLLRFGALQSCDNDATLLVADTGLLRRQTNFLPSIPLKQGLWNTYEWWKTRSKTGKI